MLFVNLCLVIKASCLCLCVLSTAMATVTWRCSVPSDLYRSPSSKLKTVHTAFKTLNKSLFKSLLSLCQLEETRWLLFIYPLYLYLVNYSFILKEELDSFKAVALLVVNSLKSCCNMGWNLRLLRNEQFCCTYTIFLSTCQLSIE